jgi:hypothetical protein
MLEIIAVDAGNALTLRDTLAKLQRKVKKDKDRGLNRDQRLMMMTLRLFVKFDLSTLYDIIRVHWKAVRKAVK